MEANLSIGSTSYVEVYDLADQLTGELDFGATITATVKTPGGLTVEGDDFPKELNLVNESPLTGLYRVSLYPLDLEPGKRYLLCLNIEMSDGVLDYREIDCIARIRGDE